MKLTQEEKDQTYTIDLLRHAASGEKYVAATVAIWDVNGDCTGHKIIAMAGPLSYSEIADLIDLDAYNWDADNDFDLDRVNAETADQEWLYDYELADGTGPVW